MGLRTASVRRPYVEVMAPALTETTQNQTFKLPPSSKDHHHLHQPASPINAFDRSAIPPSKYLPDVSGSGAYLSSTTTTNNIKGADLSEKLHINGNSNCTAGDDFINNIDITSNCCNNQKEEENNLTISNNKCCTTNSDLDKQASGYCGTGDDSDIIMSDSPTSMGDQSTRCSNNDDDKMGLGKSTDIEESIAKIHTNDKPPPQSNNEMVDQIFNNLTSTDGELPQNVDELMQVFKSIETNQSIDSNIENVEDLPTIEKFLTEVDMMNMSMEDQQELESAQALKETKTKDLIAELKKRQAQVERRLDFLLRKVHKLQARNMGQHVSGEVAGVFEYVHRSLKRLKETTLIPLEPTSSTSVTQILNDDGKSMGTTTTLTPSSSTTTIPTTPAAAPLLLPSTTPLTQETIKPISYGTTKALLKKLEMAAALQANAVAKQKTIPRYFGSGSSETSNRLNVQGIINVPPWALEHKQELQKVSGLLQTELSLVQHEVDSEATESSSGGESCDEMQSYNNPHQQYLAIQKRALWKYASVRAQIAAKWTWLQAQITDLEYRIRQHNDLHRQIRASKGEIILGGASPPPPPPVSPTSSSPQPQAVNGYRGQLPGSSATTTTSIGAGTTPKQQQQHSENDDTTLTNNGACVDYQCARTRPLMNFKKRKLLQISGLHIISKKAARPSNIRCGCVPTTMPCAVCTGRTDPTHPRDPPDALSKAERIALVDPAFHPVFSLPDDVSYAIHCDAIMKSIDWQQRSTRMKSMKVTKGDRSDTKGILEHRTKKLEHRKKYNRLLKPSTVSALSAKIKNKIRSRRAGRNSSSTSSTSFRKRSTSKGGALHGLGGSVPSGDGGIDDEIESIGNNSTAGASTAASPSSSPLLHMQAISGYNRRNRSNSYDIDNIVIPYSVAAATRVEKLQYKEILTPKWRIADPDFKCDNTKNNGVVRNPSQDSDAEDLSEEAVIQRHEKSEHDEKKKFLSYLKLPLGHHRSRAHKRTDSLAESSGANTPDPLSPQPQQSVIHDTTTTTTTTSSTTTNQNENSPLTSPPATPLLPSGTSSTINSSSSSVPNVATVNNNNNGDENHLHHHLQHNQHSSTVISNLTTAVNRRRTISQSKFARDNNNGTNRDDANTPEYIEIVAPYDTRTFPLDEELYEKMLKNMPENHQLFQTNAKAQDSNSDNNYSSTLNYLDEKVDSPGSESTESAIGEEDPNDPEWIDMERSRDRHKR